MQHYEYVMRDGMEQPMVRPVQEVAEKQRPPQPRHAAKSTVFGRVLRSVFGDPQLKAYDRIKDERLRTFAERVDEIMSSEPAPVPGEILAAEELSDTEPRGILTPQLMREIDMIREAGLPEKWLAVSHPELFPSQSPGAEVAETAVPVREAVVETPLEAAAELPAASLQSQLDDIKARRLKPINEGRQL